MRWAFAAVFGLASYGAAEVVLHQGVDPNVYAGWQASVDWPKTIAAVIGVLIAAVNAFKAPDWAKGLLVKLLEYVPARMHPPKAVVRAIEVLLAWLRGEPVPESAAPDTETRRILASSKLDDAAKVAALEALQGESR